MSSTWMFFITGFVVLIELYKDDLTYDFDCDLLGSRALGGLRLSFSLDNLETNFSNPLITGFVSFYTTFLGSVFRTFCAALTLQFP